MSNYLNKPARGFSLLEVLIAMLILAFGVLGIAGLQLKSLQASHSGYQRGLANIIAADTVERLWANSAAAAPLTIAQIQEEINAHWQSTVNNNVALPGVTTTVVGPVAGGTLYTVQVSWTETRFSEQATTFNYSFRLYP